MSRYLYPVTPFKFLGRDLSAADEEWTAVVHNLWRELQKWKRLTRLLIMDGEDAWTLRQIYLAVIKPVMINESETWVMKPRIGRVWSRSRHRGGIRLTGRQPWRVQDGGWVYPSLEDAMEEVGLH